MFGFLYALAASFFGATANVLFKHSINRNGLYTAITYNYVFLALLLLSGALFLGFSFSFPSVLFLPYLVQVIIGAAAVLALFKAFEEGRASILGPLSKSYIIIVLFISVLFLSEVLSSVQLFGSIFLMLSACILAFEDFKNFKIEKGVLFLLLTIFGWGYYYSFIKIFVPVLGPYSATFFLELGVGFFVILFSLVTKKDITPPSISGAKFIALGSAFIFLMSISYAYSVDTIGAGLTSAITASSSIFIAVLSYFTLKEKLNTVKYLSILLMVLGLVLVFLG